MSATDGISTAPTAAASSTAGTPTAPADDTGHAKSTSGATSTEIDERTAFQIDCLRNARYHEDRESFFSFAHKGAMFVVVASGTAAFASVKAQPTLAAVITLAALIDLVFDVSGKARLHASIRRRIYDVLAQAEDEQRSLARLKEQAVRIYADEPPCMHAVNAIAYNAAMAAFERPKGHQLQVNWWQRLTRHFWPWSGTKFVTFDEIARANAGSASPSA